MSKSAPAAIKSRITARRAIAADNKRPKPQTGTERRAIRSAEKLARNWFVGADRFSNDYRTGLAKSENRRARYEN